MSSGSVLGRMPSLSPVLPGIPPGVSVRKPGDHKALRQATFDNALKSFQELQPVSNAMYTLRIDNPHYEGPDKLTKEDHKKAIMRGESLTRKLRGEWSLVDNNTGNVISSKKATLAEVPYITDTGTTVLDGVDYAIAHQTRLKPGIFARIKSSGEAEAHINLLPGRGRQHHLVLEPGKGTFKVHFDQAAIPLMTLLRAFKTPETKIRESLGDLYDANNKADNVSSMQKLLEKVVRKPSAALPHSDQIVQELEKWRMDPDVSRRSLGQPFDKPSADFYLAAAKRVLDVNKGADPDDRDALYNQVVVGPEDMIAERIRNSRGVMNKMLFKATLNRSVDKIPSGAMSKAVRAAIIGSGLGNPLEETNPLELMDQATRITRMGEGGLPSYDAIPMDSRMVSPSHYGFIDPIRTPESLSAGVDMRLAKGVLKGSDGRLYAPFRDVRTGQTVYRSPQDVMDKNIAFSMETSRKKKKLRSIIRSSVLGYVSPEEVDYEPADNDDTFNHLADLILAKSGIANQRVAMGSRMLTQAMPLANPEAPLVRPGPNTDGTPFTRDSYYRQFGDMAGAIRAKKDGVVKSVKNGIVRIAYDDGSQEDEELYQWHPMNRKSYLHQEPVVKAGQKIRSGDLIARSNNTDKDGIVAPGTNLYTAYAIRDGYNFEDAISISESAARKKLASDHMYQHGIEWDDNHIRGKSGFLGAYPSKYSKNYLDALDEDGVIKPGETVETGQPLIVAARKRDAKHGKVLRGHTKTVEDASQIWERSTPGVVTDVTKTRHGTVIAVKSTIPVEVSDKLSGLFGDKSIIAEVIPDHLMPHDKNGRPFDAIANPLGVVTRGNASQVTEAVLGKIAEKRGRHYDIADWQEGDEGGRRHWMKLAIREALKHGVETKEDIIDPRTGKTIPRVLTGNRYMLRLHHLGEDKIQARGTAGGYDQWGQPNRGKTGGAKRFSLAELYAVLGHGAYGVLEDRALRSTKNSEWFSRFMAGQDVPEPKLPEANERFLAMLRSAGIDPVRNDTRTNLMAMTDKGINDLAEDREITNAETVNWDDNLRPVEGGLFDTATTGGHDGKLWSFISLPFKVPNPVMEDPIRRVLGLTGKEMNEVISGTKELGRFGTGPEAIYKSLDAIDLDREIDNARQQIAKRRGSGRDSAVRTLKYLKRAQANNLHPRDWMISKVPVIPPKFRPIDVMSDTGRPIVSDANYLYRDLMFAKQSYDTLQGKTGDLSNERLAIYNAVKAVTGLGNPINPKNAATGIKGMLKSIIGSGPKFSVVQRKLLSTPVDMVTRSVISPDPNLGLDEVGLPEESAWGSYEPIIIRQLSRRGMAPNAALEATRSRSEIARTEMLKAMANHPVIMSRAPVHHKFGTMAFWPRLVKGNSIRMNAFVTKGFGADFDGDQVNIQVPVLETGIRDAIEKMLPSKNLLHPRDFKPHYKPINEFAGGLYEASTSKSDQREQVFESMEAAIRAYREGRIGLGTPVAIAE